MHYKTSVLAAAAGFVGVFPAVAQAHVSLHPNAIPAGSFATTNIRVPNEEPHAGGRFSAKTKKLAKPIKTDHGLVTTETTEVDFTRGKILPGDFENFPLTLSIPDSAKQGDVIAFPTVQTYSDGHVVHWIGAATADSPAPTVDITAAGSALLDVTGGDAGPPSPLPTNLTGASRTAAAAPARTIVKKQSSGLAIVALIAGALGLILGAVALATRRKDAGVQA